MEKRFVVCIDDSGMNDPHPKLGEIYTVDGVSEISPYHIHLREFTHKSFYYQGHIVAYNIRCFRPVDMSFGERVCESIERQPVKQLA